jgi:hypothetical protein
MLFNLIELKVSWTDPKDAYGDRNVGVYALFSICVQGITANASACYMASRLKGMLGSIPCVVCSEAIVGWNVQRRLIGGNTVEIAVQGRGRGSGSFTTVHSYT